MTEKITASEAVYGFAAWLTTRDEPVTFGASHDSAGPAELVKQYTEHNGMEPPRDGIWPDNVSMPNAPRQDRREAEIRSEILLATERRAECSS